MKRYPEKYSPEWHKLQIAINTVKNPMKGIFLGGPSLNEAQQTVNEYGLKL
jgi:hypothetical protein